MAGAVTGRSCPAVEGAPVMLQVDPMHQGAPAVPHQNKIPGVHVAVVVVRGYCLPEGCYYGAAPYSLDVHWCA